MSAIVQLYPHKSYTTRWLQTYLEKDGRVLEKDFSPFVLNRFNWAEEFDSHRKAWKKNSGRTCFHFVLSPDIKDEATLEQVRNMATTWASDNFNDCLWSINYHEDNGIVHAHVAVNAIKLDGYHLHLNDNEFNGIRLDLQGKALKNGLYNKPYKTKKERYKQQIKEKERGETPQLSYSTKTVIEKRIESKGFKTWKQQLRDYIDINKQYATCWDDFVKKMDEDGIEVKETRNKLTGETGYTYRFKEPVFNKKTGKEFQFACKDKNLSDDEKDPKKYTREAIYSYFNFSGEEIENKNEIKIIKRNIQIEMLKYYGYQAFVMPTSHRPIKKNIVFNPLPKEIKTPNVHIYHNKLARSTIQQSQANIQAMVEAIRIVKENDIKSNRELQIKIKEMKKQAKKYREEGDWLRDKHLKAELIYTNLQEFEHAKNKDAKKWLKKHNIDPKNTNSSKYKKEMDCYYKQYTDIVNKEIELRSYSAQLERAFRIISENIKPENLKRRCERYSAEEVKTIRKVNYKHLDNFDINTSTDNQEEAASHLIAQNEIKRKWIKESTSDRGVILHNYINAPTLEELHKSEDKWIKSFEREQKLKPNRRIIRDETPSEQITRHKQLLKQRSQNKDISSKGIKK